VVVDGQERRGRRGEREEERRRRRHIAERVADEVTTARTGGANGCLSCGVVVSDLTRLGQVGLPGHYFVGLGPILTWPTPQ
jgi:hypothetical protein